MFLTLFPIHFSKHICVFYRNSGKNARKIVYAHDGKLYKSTLKIFQTACLLFYRISCKIRYINIENDSCNGVLRARA